MYRRASKCAQSQNGFRSVDVDRLQLAIGEDVVHKGAGMNDGAKLRSQCLKPLWFKA